MRPFSPLVLFFSAVFVTAGAASQLTACATKAVDKACNQDDDTSELRMCGTRPGMVKGIDVSSENGAIDWAQVKKAGYGWAYVQVSDGLKADARFEENWRGIKSAGLVRGAYQYFYPKQDAEKQAELYVKALKDAGKIGIGDLPPVLDLEETDDLSGKEIVAAATTWLETVEKATGRKAMIMTNPAMAKAIGTTFKDRGLWIAQYRNDCPDLPTSWKSWSWDFWTYSERLKVPGVQEGTVYSAFFQGSANDLKVLTLEASPDGGAGDGGAAGDAGARDGSTSASDGGAREGGSTRDGGTTTRDAGGGAAQDSGASTSDAGAPGDDGGGIGAGGNGNTTSPQEEEEPMTPPTKAKSGPRAQREEDPKADPCAKKLEEGPSSP
jgi:lysozyme